MYGKVCIIGDHILVYLFCWSKRLKSLPPHPLNHHLVFWNSGIFENSEQQEVPHCHKSPGPYLKFQHQATLLQHGLEP